MFSFLLLCREELSWAYGEQDPVLKCARVLDKVVNDCMEIHIKDQKISEETM